MRRRVECIARSFRIGRWEQECSLPMATDLGPVRATHKKKLYSWNVNNRPSNDGLCFDPLQKWSMTWTKIDKCKQSQSLVKISGQGVC